MSIKINDIVRLKDLPGPDMVVHNTYRRGGSNVPFKVDVLYIGVINKANMSKIPF